MAYMKHQWDGFEADSINASFAKVETQMGRILEGRARVAHLGRQLSDDDVLPNTRGIDIDKVDMEPVPFGWADDQQVPSSRSFGVHFGMVKDANTGAYRALAPLIVSTDAVLMAFEDIWPSDSLVDKADLEGCLEFHRRPLSKNWFRQVDEIGFLFFFHRFNN
ncbi:hypothetical protein QBC40DRAFT_258921 [Triangularia verruculosa]|uniref:Uncharacterized protein n=1 Tax=Triangularia verruculosa TaxID=2587418 RepID=A0AAN6X7E6_9PEZI|nr:hypothetical protein QBC40DRAFT_258921 [Triangularia verruculosa]